MSDQDQIQRTVLPIPDQPRTGLITYDAKDPETKFPPITQLRPPKGAPNGQTRRNEANRIASAIAMCC